jgi:tetratricopeptide (TPR) repeat protein
VSQSRLAEAEDIFRQALTALRNFPDQVAEAQFALAEITFYRGSIDTAQILYQELAIKPNTDIANDALDRLSLLQSVMNEKQRSALKLIAQAELLEKQRRTDEAVVLYRDAMTSAPRSLLHERSLYRLARLYAGEQMRSSKTDIWQSAIAVCDTLVAQFPDGVFTDEALLLWGQLLIERAMYAERESSQLNATSNAPAGANSASTGAILLEEAKQRRADAVNVFTQILIKFPKSPLAGEARKRIRTIRGDV